MRTLPFPGALGCRTPSGNKSFQANRNPNSRPLGKKTTRTPSPDPPTSRIFRYPTIDHKSRKRNRKGFWGRPAPLSVWDLWLIVLFAFSQELVKYSTTTEIRCSRPITSDCANVDARYIGSVIPVFTEIGILTSTAVGVNTLQQ